MVEREKVRREQHLYMRVRVVSDRQLQQYEGPDLTDFENQHLDIPTFKILKDDTFAKFKEQLSEFFGVPVDEFRLWTFCTRQNKTFRPDVPINVSDDKTSKALTLVNQLLTFSNGRSSTAVEITRFEVISRSA